MEHFYQNIPGWFNCENLYRFMVATAKNGARFVEIGVWKGKSSAFMGVEIINSGKNIEFYAVDHFLGSPELMADNDIVNGTLLERTTKTLEPVKSVVQIYPYKSLDAAKMFADESLDFVYVDGAHEYDDVKADIEAWLPKVKKGGIIAGDDYGVGIHPDVKRVVDELFPFSVKDGLVWIQQKV